MKVLSCICFFLNFPLEQVDGNWGSWQAWNACSQTCGLGQKTRTRFCDSPSPQHGGKPCAGSDEETAECNEKDCPPGMSVEIIFIPLKMCMTWHSTDDFSGVIIMFPK